MKKSFQKFISVVLVALMLVTPLSSGIFALAASVAVDSTHKAVIAVPETVYMTPSTGESTKGQYYINNTVANGSYTLNLEANAANENGYVQFYIPGAVKFKFSVNTVTAGIGDIRVAESKANSGSYENQEFEVENGYFAYNSIGMYISGTGISAGQAALAEWVFTVTMDDGSIRTYYAYSVLYSPNYHSVGATAEARQTSSNQVDMGGWISGIHTVTTADAPFGGSDGSDGTGKFKSEPLLDLTKPMTPYNSAVADNLEASPDGLIYAREFYRSSANHGRTKSPVGVLTVDYSRNTNLNTIPNVYVGGEFLRADYDGNNNNQHFYGRYMLGNGTQHTSMDVDDQIGGTQFITLGSSGGTYSGTLVSTLSSGTNITDFENVLNDANSGRSLRIYTRPNITIAASGTQYLYLHTQVRFMKNSTNRYANTYSAVQIKTVDKATLRQNVLYGSSLNAANYTSASWDAYKTELRNAALNLGNPTSENVSTSALTTKRDALQTNIEVSLNGGTLDIATPTAITVGTKNSVAITTAIPNPPTRTGHTFLGWARLSDPTTVDKNLVVGFNERIQAVWQANSYALLYDNLFSTVDFANTAASMKTNRQGATATYNKADNSITVVSDNVDEQDVFTLYGSGPEYYSIPVNGSTEYIVEFDVETNGGAQFFLFLYNSNGGTLVPSDRTYTFKTNEGAEGSGRDDDASNKFMNVYVTETNSGHYVLKFRTPADAQKMTVRFGNFSDVNVTSTFSNIRMIDAANYYEDVNYSETAKVYTYQDGAKYGTLFNPIRTAYTFGGWYTAPNGNGISIDANTANADKSTTLYSKWTPVTYTITFNTDGGANVSALTYTYEDINRALPVSNKPGYAFDGWLVEKADGNWDSSEPYYNINKNYGNITLKANFVDPEYQINLSFADDEINNGIVNYHYSYHKDFIFDESVLPTKNGHKFTGWQVVGKSDGATWNIGTQYRLIDGKVTIPKGNEGSVTLKPMWEMVNYTISFNTDGGEGIAPTSYNIITSITLPEPKKAGYKFTGWTVSSSDGNWTESYSAGQELTGMYGNVTLKANWVANGYSVTFNPNGGEVNPSSISYDITGSINIPTPTRTGYTFNNWKVETEVGNWSGSVDGGKTLREMYGNVTLVAQWTPISYTIIYDTPGEAISPAPYTIETELNIPASVRNGFKFTGWTVKTPDGNWIQDGTINAGKLNAGMYGNVTLTANFEVIEYTLTFNYDGINPVEYDITKPIFIENIEKAGYTFKGWEVAESSGSWTKGTIINSGNLSNGRYGNVTLNPVFTPNNYEITFIPDGGIMDSDTLAYTPDDLTTLPTPTKTGYDFLGWKVTVPFGSWDADEVIPGGTSLKGKYGNVTLTAQWKAKTFTITWVDGDGKTIGTDTVEYGETPVYTGATPTKAATAQYTYTFNETWSPAIVSVTEAATYVAQFDATVNTYTVTWKYEKDTTGTIETVTEEYKYGDYPVFNNGAIPEKASAPGSNIVYRFTGWTPTVATVTGDVTYVAQFVGVEATAKVTWVIDGKSQVTLWAQGETPEYPGIPTKPDEGGYKYTFSDWTPVPQEITDPNGEYTYTANFTKTAKEYTVSFMLNGGSGADTQYSYTNETEAFPWIITNKPGYSFAGWKLVKVDSESSGWTLNTIYDDSDFVQGNWGNVTFEAQWEPADYTITIFSTGEEITYNIESDKKLSAEPKDGYVLSGWIIVSTSGAGNWREGDIVAVDKALTGMYGNVTVEPMWSAMPYKLTLISGEHTQVIEIKYGDIVDEYYPVAKPGYTAKWNNELPETMPKEDVTLTAEYKPIQYFLNFDVAGGNKVNGFYYDITSENTLPVPTHPGAEFVQWVVADGNGSWYKGATVGGNEALKGHYGSATLTAQWKLKSYTVTWDIDGTKKLTQWYYSATPSFEGTPYKAPDADHSYKFIGWDKEITPVTKDVTYIAQFEAVERTYTVKWQIGNYIVEENYKLGDTPVYKGETPTKPATNEYEYIFIGWAPSIEAVDSDITYTAQFQTNVKLLGIRIDKTTLFMSVGEEDVLRAILSPATATNKDIIWSSSDESVATIDENGKVTAVGAGIAIICVQSANGKVRAYSVVSVSPVINQYVVVSAGGISTTRLPGQSIQLTATLMPDNEVIKNVTWTSSNPEVAYVEESGLVIYGLVPGTAVITATVDGYIAGSIEVTTTDNSGDIVDRVKTYIVSFNASTSQYIIGDIVYDNISIVYAEGDTVEFLLTEPHFAMANGVQLERDTDGVFRIENIQQNYVISTTTRADIGIEDDTDEEEPKLSFFDKIKAFFQTIIDFFRNLFR